MTHKRNTERMMEVRAARAKLRAALKAGEVDSLALLRGELPEWEPVIATWPLHTLLPRIPGIGKTKEVVIYANGQFPPAVPMKALSDERREELARLVERHRQVPYNAPSYDKR